MAKRFDCEEEPNDFMEMPCRCDCGNWFDLNDGHNNNHSNKVICRECYESEVKEQELYRQAFPEDEEGWEEDDDFDEEGYFIPCSRCDGHPACEDFGCAIEAGLAHLVKKDFDDL